MAYIGKEPIVGNFQKCDAITVVNGQAAYTLQVSSTNVVPESANHMLVSLNGILQAPVTSFTVSGSTLTFASNLATGDVIDFVILLGNVLDLGTPSDGTVTAAKVANDLISGKTALASAPADTDEFLVSDAGTLKRIDYSLIKPGLTKILSTTISSAVASVEFNSTYVTSAYNNYRIVLTGMSTASDNQDIALKMSVDNGSNFATHVGGYIWVHLNTAVDNQWGSDGNLAYWSIGLDEEATAEGSTNGFYDIWDTQSTTMWKQGTGRAVAKNQNGEYYWYTTGGLFQSTSAVNYIKIYTAGGGNLDAGTVTLYGYN